MLDVGRGRINPAEIRSPFAGVFCFDQSGRRSRFESKNDTAIPRLCNVNRLSNNRYVLKDVRDEFEIPLQVCDPIFRSFLFHDIESRGLDSRCSGERFDYPNVQSEISTGNCIDEGSREAEDSKSLGGGRMTSMCRMRSGESEQGNGDFSISRDERFEGRSWLVVWVKQLLD